MDNYENGNDPLAHLNATDFIGGYLAKEDLTAPTLVTIAEVRAEAMEGASRRKLVVKFAELEKALVLNTTNISRLTSLFGTSECSHWIGQQVTVFVDDNVQYAGRRVGGIRVTAARPNGPNSQPYSNSVRQTNYEPEFA